ncbi:hypothetical protein SLEP1_g15286 [Rubroshorea leprosula]|uniref:Retrotransposon gag domain-containing protein n=1 Tax=Rubroshorea leprosula TaxID=152421 RepID=A0AAV5IXC5_9ROSI|nr:hypothetical protein SLEP1_g15286 [Rubroshorea leprosula]
MDEGQRQHKLIEAVAPVADHGHQPQHRPAMRPLVSPAYKKPYTDIIDHENLFPRGFKVPKFTLFSSEASQSTIEHIGRFTIQCGEASGDDNLKLKLFPSSLTGIALTWYLSLPQNSVYSWRQMEDFFHTQFYRCELEVSMADLSRLAQKPGESSEAFLARFQRARLKCRVSLQEQEFVKLVLNEDVQKKAASHGTYYNDPNFDLDMAEVVTDKPVVCPDLIRPTHQPETSVRHYVNKAKETMEVDADPFPTVSVSVNVPDLRSVARNRYLPYAQRNLAVKDLRWVIEAQRSRHSRSVRSDWQRPGGQGRIIVTKNFSPESTKPHSTGTRSPRMIKPPLRSPFRRWEKVNHPKFPTQNPRTLRPHQPTKRNMVWVRKEKKEVATHTLLEEEDQSPASPKVASVIVGADDMLKATFEAQEQSENVGNGGKAKVVSADDRPFSANTHLVEARYYKEDIGTIQFFGMDRHGKLIGITAVNRPSLSKRVVEEVCAVGTFEWIVMPFGLKNTEATYQRAMNAIFHDMIGKFMEIYIDDVVVKSHDEDDHLIHLRKAFEWMRQHGLKMNPLKCTFGVSVGNFLRYLVHKRGLEIEKNKAKAVIEAQPPQAKKEL